MNTLMFDGMIDKYLQGKYTGKYQEILDQWFDIQQMDESLITWPEEGKRNTKHRILQVIDNIELEKAGHEKAQTVPQKRKDPRKDFKINRWFRAAAAILIVILATYAAWVDKTGEMRLFPLASEKVTKVMLRDGSIVWLKGKDSKLIYPNSFTGNVRYVTLHGEALFEIANDPQRPFIIQCGGLSATVLGTSFSIQSDTMDTKVVVLTGKLSISIGDGKETVVVRSSEKVIYNHTDKQLVKSATEYADVQFAVKGTEYHMDFEDARMREIVSRIESKFDVAVSVGDLSLCNCLVTADFTGQSLNSTLDLLSQGLNIGYTIKDNRVLLDGQGCKE